MHSTDSEAAAQAAVAPAVGGSIAGVPARLVTARLVDARSMAAMIALVALSTLAIAVAVAPVTTCVVALAGTALVLARRRPELALALGFLAFGFEGSVKLLLELEPTPVAGDARAVGAAAVDLVLFAAVVGLVASDRLRTPRALWAGAGRGARCVIVLLSAWLVVSVVQIPQSGDLHQGLAGFRLFHLYALVALAAAIAFAASGATLRNARALLVIGLAVALYAAVRVVTGPAFEERELALGAGEYAAYGSSLKGVGSFSGAPGLTSFLTPIATFGLVAGYLEPGLRRLAWPAAALALVGLGGTYTRAPLVAVGVGLALALGVTITAAGVRRRRKLAAVGLALAVLAAMYGGLEAAGTSSDVLRGRAHRVFQPWADNSVQARMHLWEKTAGGLPDHPLGRGLGTVGRAHPRGAGVQMTTDNSVLKVAVDQGIPVAVLFLLGTLGAIGVLVARLRSLEGERRAVGIAAVAGFASFFVLATTGEFVEQPGKVVAWGLLGMAAALALAPVRRVPDRGSRRARPRASLRAGPRASRRVLWVGVTAVLVVVPVALSLGRDGAHSASMRIVPGSAGPGPAVRGPAYYRSLVHDERLPYLMRATTGAAPKDYQHAAFRVGRDGSVVATLSAADPDGAARVLTKLGHWIVVMTNERLPARAPALARGRLAPDEALRVRRRARQLGRLEAAQGQAAGAGAPAVTARPSRWADRVADAVPGRLPARPEPFWAGVAGALVAALLWVVSGLPPRRPRADG